MIDPYILGISALYHDAAAALTRGEEIIAAAQEERFTRRKHDPRFPHNAIYFCLEQARINPYELDAIVYYDNPLLTLDRFIHNIACLGEEAEKMVDKSFTSLFGGRMWVHKYAEKTLGGMGKNGLFFVVRHHAAHAASAFYPSPFKNAAILTMDGVGEWATTTIGVGHNAEISFLKEISYPHSLGLLYTAFTTFCGFKANSGDYKLMGLAPYGKPIYADMIKQKIIDIKPDGSFQLNMEYFAYQRDIVMTGEKFAEIFGGPARRPETEITRREMDIACSAQKVLEEVVLLLARTTKNLTGERNLCLAGGVALNCVANGKLRREKIFDDIWIQPAAGDAGGALGAALFAAHNHFNIARVAKQRGSQGGSALGPEFSPASIQTSLDDMNAVYHKFEDRGELFGKIAEYLADGKAVGFFNGRMEFGPRALGNRSILADPRDPRAQSRLNLQIKFRESFRPFAPSVLAERAADFFEIDGESPYMLFCADVNPHLRKKPLPLEEKDDNKFAVDMLTIVNQERSTLPAVTHIDNSSRLQTVSKNDNPHYYALLKAFDRLTGCPVLVNTSFNVRGEPIVCTPADAYRCFMRTGLDILALENFLLLKSEQPPLPENADWRRKYALD
jgi:carbamoyltransferase